MILSFYFLEFNPVIKNNTLLWDGILESNVASEDDCEDICIANSCKTANYYAVGELCFVSTSSSKVRRINTVSSMSMSGGSCNVSHF